MVIIKFFLMCIAIMHIHIYTYDNKHVMKYCDVRTNVMYVLITTGTVMTLCIYIYIIYTHIFKRINKKIIIKKYIFKNIKVHFFGKLEVFCLTL